MTDPITSPAENGAGREASTKGVAAVEHMVELLSAAQSRAAAAEAEVVRLTKERDEARAYGKEVGTALVGLTCDGSEFYRRAGDEFQVDPAACTTYLRRQREAHHDRVFFAAKRAQEAEATASALRDRVKVLEEALKKQANRIYGFRKEMAFALGSDGDEALRLWELSARAALTSGGDHASD